MRARATLLDLAPRENTTTDTHLVLSLIGEDTGTPRPRLGLVPVVDRSGSMGVGGKLRTVTAALEHLGGYLGAEDHLALVAFDTDAATLLPAQRADRAARARFGAALDALAPRQATNLSVALARGLAEAGAMPADALVRVIVLTDGRPTAGDTSRAALLAQLADAPAHVSVSFLGVGTDCDHDLLGALARAGRGSYGFIETAARAGDVLGAEVGGLLETEVHQLVATLTARAQYARLDGMLGIEPEPAEVTTLRLELGRLLVGQTRHVVVPVRLRGPRRRHARPVTVAEVHLAGLVDDAPIEAVLRPKVHFGSAPGPLDPDLLEAVELAQVAAAQRRAERAAAGGDFAAAADAFAALSVRSGAALGLSQSLALNYADGARYAASAPLRSSSAHALTGSLAGSGEAFDALASRTIGAYTTAGQRDVAAATAAATLDPGATGVAHTVQERA